MIILILLFLFNGISASSENISEFVIKKPKVAPVNNKHLKEKLVQESADFLKNKNELDAYLIKLEKRILELLESGLDNNFKKHEIKNLKKILIEVEDLNNSIKGLSIKLKDQSISINNALCQNKNK